MRNRVNQIWGTFILIIATYTAIEIPLWIVLDYKPNSFLIIMSLFVSFSFLLDLIYIIYQLEQKQNHKLLNRYLKRSFVLDFLSIIPYDLVIIYWALPPSLDFLAFVRILRITKLARVSGFVERWGKGEFSNPAVMRIVYFLYWIFIILHWVACAWLVIHGRETTIVNGVETLQDNLTAYIRALYWSMTTLTTIGYGDIVPKTNIETVFVLSIEFLGAGMYGYIIGNIANLLSNVDFAKAKFIEKMDRINTFMRYRKLPKDLQEKVHQYYSYLWEHKRGYDESSILEELPVSLKMKVALFLNKEMLERIPLFKGASDPLLDELVLNLKPIIFTPNDYIFRKGDMGKSLYFLVKGSVAVMDEQTNTIYATLTEGNFFGEVALLTSAPRNATVKANDYCDLYTLDKDTFDSIIIRYPDFAAEIKQKAKQRMETK